VSGAYDATTAEKLEGTSRGVKADSLPHPSVPHLPLLLHPRFTHSLLYSSFPSLLNRARRFGGKFVTLLPTIPSEKKTTIGCKIWRGPNVLCTHHARSQKLDGTRPTARIYGGCAYATVVLRRVLTCWAGHQRSSQFIQQTAEEQKDSLAAVIAGDHSCQASNSVTRLAGESDLASPETCCGQVREGVAWPPLPPPP